DFHFDSLRPRMPESIAQRFARDPVDFVPEDRMEVLRRAFHFHLKEGRILVGAFSPEFFSESPYCRAKVIGLDGGCTQPLYSIPALGDRLGRPINRGLKCFP